ncbi:MAG: hypothetical protein JSV15_06385, partial [Candidatus Bathyarchaeota archaeon]
MIIKHFPYRTNKQSKNQLSARRVCHKKGEFAGRSVGRYLHFSRSYLTSATFRVIPPTFEVSMLIYVF